MEKPLSSFIVPTLREADNIPVLIMQIHEVMTKEKLPYEIVIVDDDSRDGSEEVVKDLAAEGYPVGIHVRVGEKGLSSAVIKGFSLAHGEILVVMDADLSHPPSVLPDLVRPIIDEKSEFVIGSRFVAGGSAHDFNWFRKLNAWGAKTLARPLARVTDPMSGLFAISRRILPDPSILNPLGFKIGLELLVKADPDGITEIPITFQKRLYGSSKLSLSEQILYLLHLRRLYTFKYKNMIQFVEFSLVGGTGVLVNLFFVFFMYQILSVPYVWSLVIGFFFAFTSNFILNKVITFSELKKRNIFMQYFSFFLTCILGLFFNMLISNYLYETIHFFRHYYMLTTLIGVVAGTIVNFAGSKFLVFRE